jgi:hypothetical protein
LFRKTYIENAFASFFATLGYTFNKSIRSLVVRVKTVPIFWCGSKYRYLPLWAAFAAWRVKEESFFKEASWLNDLKFENLIRVQGNIDKGTSRYIMVSAKRRLVTWTNRGDYLPTNLPMMFTLGEDGHMDTGFDIAMLDNRIYFSADFYHRKSTELIGVRTVALENGMSTVTTNFAALTNKASS